MYHNEEGKGIEKEYREQEPPTLCSEIDRTARANSEQSCGGSCSRVIRQTASRKAAGPDEVPAELFKAGGAIVLD